MTVAYSIVAKPIYGTFGVDSISYDVFCNTVQVASCAQNAG